MSALFAFALMVGLGTFGAIFGGSVLSRHASERRLEELLRKLWAFFDGPVTFRPPRAEDAALVQRLDAIDTTSIERHFIRLGDVIMESAAREPLRLFRDQGGEIVVYVIALSTSVSIGFESYTTEQELVTLRSSGVDRSIVTFPPFSHHAYVPASTPLDAMLDAHRELVARVAPGPLLPVTTLDAAIRQLDLFATRIRTWRAAENPEGLLQSDLRAALGDDRFARDGARFAKRLKTRRSKLPVARAHRV